MPAFHPDQLVGLPGVFLAIPVERPFPELLAYHRVKVRLPQGGIAVCGRNGIRSVTHALQFNTAPAEEIVLRVGDFTEPAGNLNLLLGGEHQHDHIFNVTMGPMPLLRTRLEQNHASIAQSHSKGAITIGSGAVISYGATIRSGVTIGEGAVIGANAVVVRDVPPFAIVAGNPARVIRMRFDDATIEALLRVRWWNLTYESLITHAATIAQLHEPEIRAQFLETAKLQYDVAEDYLVCSVQGTGTSSQFNLLGIERGGQFTPANQTHAIFQFYFQQLGNAAEQPTYYFENVFVAHDALTSK